jgi:serine/threonine protein kinase/tetratricopeptide (TPR) repeat protein
MPLDPRRVKQLFAAALELPDAEARQAFLDRECGADADLRQRLETLLAANDAPHPALNQPLVAEAPDATAAYVPLQDAADAIGAVLAGKYKLLQKIGEGGMGSVFMADQTQPVKRRVALKVIKAGMDTVRVLARFEAERQALALMDHPHIAKVLDAGTTDTGRPFFVMELVKGIPLTQFCDGDMLPVLERLNLFRQVCAAVQHAHQKGIIHRDLKPTNILVERHDGQPVPKVIDFGLAKATSGMQLTEHTLFTALGQVAGTPLYMAPEQAAFNAIDVDTRADVYALGVVLYELLTGTTPIERATFKKAAFDEILRVIREQEPPAPSSRISSSDCQASVAAMRKMEPAKLGRFVRGELDWIVMKSLSKERDRRYESATAFARDVERFLNHEPVQAGPPTAGYRLRKFVQRNRLQVIAAGMVLLALIAGVAGTTFGLFRAENALAAEAEQRSIAERNQKKAEASATSEAKQREIAERREREATAAERLALQREQEEKKAREQAEEVSRFMRQVFAQGSAHGQASKTREVNRTLTVKEAMDFAAKAIEGRFADRPEIEAALRNTIGKTYFELASYEEAEPHLKTAVELREKALGADHPDTLTSVNDLATLFEAKADYTAAEPLYERALAGRERVLGADHPDTLGSINNLAQMYAAVGKFEAAEPLLKRALAGQERVFGPDHEDTLTTVNNLAALAKSKGDFATAEVLLKRVLAGMEKTLSMDHPYTLRSARNLAVFYHQNLNFAAAEPLFKRVLAGMENIQGPDHADTLRSVADLASLYLFTGNHAAALPLAMRAMTGQEKALGPSHPDTLATVNTMAGLYMSQGAYADAEPLLKRILAGLEENLGADHPDTIMCLRNLGGLYSRMKRFDLSTPLFEDAVRRYQATVGAEHPETLSALANLGANYKDAGRLDDAIPLLEQAYRSRAAVPNSAVLANQLIDAYVKAGKRTEATRLVTELLAENRPRLKPGSPELGGLLASIGKTLLDFDPVAAEPVLRECLAIREKLAPGAWNTANAKSLLGGALLLQQKYVDAEPMLIAGYEGLKTDEQAIPPPAKNNLPDAIQRLVDLYDATGRPDEVAKWRKELEAAKAEPTTP